jgi:hypothetical protein
MASCGLRAALASQLLTCLSLLAGQSLRRQQGQRHAAHHEEDVGREVNRSCKSSHEAILLELCSLGLWQLLATTFMLL